MRKKTREKRIKLLTAIKNKEKYSKNNRDLLPLVSNGMIKVIKWKNILTPLECELTTWGNVWLTYELNNKKED